MAKLGGCFANTQIQFDGLIHVHLHEIDIQAISGCSGVAGLLSESHAALVPLEVLLVLGEGRNSLASHRHRPNSKHSVRRELILSLDLIIYSSIIKVCIYISTQPSHIFPVAELATPSSRSPTLPD